MDKQKSFLPNKHSNRCKYCGKVDLDLDDIDFNFYGNQDEFWKCYICGATLYVKVRYKKACKLVWKSGDEQ